jgi:hypothetical protein
LSPETSTKQAGVCYAVTDDGVELPVIDVTHPAFGVHADPAQVETAIDQWVRAMKAGLQMPPEAMRAAASQSILMRGTLAASGTFMSGMVTYLFKLGPENLGDCAGEIDRAIAGNIITTNDSDERPTTLTNDQRL